jgi:hypothetical protein
MQEESEAQNIADRYCNCGDTKPSLRWRNRPEPTELTIIPDAKRKNPTKLVVIACQ